MSGGCSGMASPFPFVRAFDLLAVMVDRCGHLVTKDELLERVWSKMVVEEAAVHVQVSALRKVLGADAIATVSGQEYRFMSRPAKVRAKRLPSNRRQARCAHVEFRFGSVRANRYGTGSRCSCTRLVLCVIALKHVLTNFALHAKQMQAQLRMLLTTLFGFRVCSKELQCVSLELPSFAMRRMFSKRSCDTIFGFSTICTSWPIAVAIAARRCFFRFATRDFPSPLFAGKTRLCERPIG
jgi:hypothetical protein